MPVHASQWIKANRLNAFQRGSSFILNPWWGNLWMGKGFYARGSSSSAFLSELLGSSGMPWIWVRHLQWTYKTAKRKSRIKSLSEKSARPAVDPEDEVEAEPAAPPAGAPVAVVCRSLKPLSGVMLVCSERYHKGASYIWDWQTI